MIAQLTGKVVYIDGVVATLDVHGVGYEVWCSQTCVQQLEVNEATTVIVYTDVKDTAITLYGFADRLERQVFSLLTEVKGVGSKSASDILSKIDKRALLRCIGSGDVTGLQAVKGIGKKTAERIVVELKDKVAAFAYESAGRRLIPEKEIIEPRDEAEQALVALGFSRRDAEQAVARVIQDGQSVTDSGELVRRALQFI